LIIVIVLITDNYHNNLLGFVHIFFLTENVVKISRMSY